MVAGSVPACTRRPRTMRNGDFYAGTACEARVLLDASSLGPRPGKSGHFEAASAWIHHLGSPSSALVSSLHS